MARRVIYEVYAKVVDSNGTYNTLSGYPKTFDSRNYGNDQIKTITRATGEYHDTIGNMCKIDTRQQQTVILLGSDGVVYDSWTQGDVADVADA